MKVHEVMSQDSDNGLQTDDLFEMAKLVPRTTGLPMAVWVSPRGNSRHDIRVNVDMTHGSQMNPTDTAVVGVRPSPHIIAGRLSPDDEKALLNGYPLILLHY